jgi:hypothetical protein
MEDVLSSDDDAKVEEEPDNEADDDGRKRRRRRRQLSTNKTNKTAPFRQLTNGIDLDLVTNHFKFSSVEGKKFHDQFMIFTHHRRSGSCLSLWVCKFLIIIS